MYTVARKADRIAMAKKLVAMIESCGAKVTQSDGCSIFPNSIKLAIKADKGLGLNIRLDGKSGMKDTHVLSWCMDMDSEAKLCPSVFASVNRYHYQKATDVAYDFDGLMFIVQNRLEAVKGGTAFQNDLKEE